MWEKLAALEGGRGDLKTEGMANAKAMRKSLPGEFKDQQCRCVAAMV